MKHLIRRGLGVALAVVMATGLLSSCGSDYDPVQDIMATRAPRSCSPSTART